jgi:predicted permease
MTPPGRGYRRAFSLTTLRSDTRAEIHEELRLYLEMRAEELMKGGMAPDQAWRTALAAFGDPQVVADQCQRISAQNAYLTRMKEMLHTLQQDIRFAFRQLLRRPGFSVAAMATLAVGIGGTVGLSSAVNGVMLRPLPFSEEEKVQVFWAPYSWTGEEFDFMRDRVSVYEDLAAYSNADFTIKGDGAATYLEACLISSGLFDVLGAEPLLGRSFRAGEDRTGAEPVIVLSYGLWQQEFGGDREILGRSVHVNGESTTVIGVMPDGFFFPSHNMRAWLPLDLDPSASGYSRNAWLVMVGRVRDGATETQVRGDLAGLSRALRERFSYPENSVKGRVPVVTPIREDLLGNKKPAIILLVAAVGLIFVMASVNVMALVLTRGMERLDELMVRAALGAGRTRLGRQVLTETLLLGLAAGGLGVLFAVLSFDGLVANLPLDPGFRETLSLDWTSLLIGLGLAVVAGLVISLAPVLTLLRRLQPELLQGHRREAGSGGRPKRMLSTLVFAEVFFAVVLTVAAALLIRSVQNLRGLDPGLDPGGVLALDIVLGEQESTPEERDQFLRSVVETAEAIPGVLSAGLINRLPIRDGGWQGGISVEGGAELEEGSRANAFRRGVTPNAFRALGVQVVQGRGIEPGDRLETNRVAVINETFADRVWPGEDPIGKQVQFVWTRSPAEVVGVVRNLAVVGLVGETPMAVYYAWEQAMAGSGMATLVIKSDLPPTSLGSSVRQTLATLDPRAAVGVVETMDEVVERALAEPVRLRFFFTLFSVLGVLLGAVGVFGVVAYGVRLRRTELGVRIVLGASPSDLTRWVVRNGMLPVVGGVLFGVGASLVAAKAMGGFLFEIGPSDPTSIMVGAGTILIAGVLAASIPGIRAARTNPVETVRAG